MHTISYHFYVALVSSYNCSVVFLITILQVDTIYSLFLLDRSTSCTEQSPLGIRERDCCITILSIFVAETNNESVAWI